MKKNFLALTVAFFSLPFLVLADDAQPGPTITPLPGGVSFGVFLNIIENNILLIIWSIALTIIIITFALAGLKFLTAQGNPNKIAEARSAVIWGIVGVAVVLLAWSAEYLINITFFNV